MESETLLPCSAVLPSVIYLEPD